MTVLTGKHDPIKNSYISNTQRKVQRKEWSSECGRGKIKIKQKLQHSVQGSKGDQIEENHYTYYQYVVTPTATSNQVIISNTGTPGAADMCMYGVQCLRENSILVNSSPLQGIYCHTKCWTVNRRNKSVENCTNETRWLGQQPTWEVSRNVDDGVLDVYSICIHLSNNMILRYWGTFCGD